MNALRTFLDQAALELMPRLVQFVCNESCACGVAATQWWEISVTAMRRSEAMAIAAYKPPPLPAVPDAPDLTEAHLLVLNTITDDPVKETAISRRTGYKIGKYLERLLRELKRHDLIVDRHPGWVRVRKSEGGNRAH